MSRTHTDDSLQEAFDAIVTEVKHPEQWFVCLMVRAPFYGGPEEGGWWGEDTFVEAYGTFLSEEIALRVKEEIEKKAAELTLEAQRAYGDQCRRECNWLEERDLDDSALPEVSGPESYYVWVGNELPEARYGNRQWE